MKNNKNSKPKTAMKTVSSRAQKRLSYLETREKAVAKKIVSLQKRIDSLPTLQKRLEDLKAKQQKIQEQKAREVKEIEELIATFKPKAEPAS
jgi:cell shape-determining protein MreC